MTVAADIANIDLRTRWLLKIAGVPAYFANFAASYDDSAGGNTHGTITSTDNMIGDPTVSGGQLDIGRNLITASTASIQLQDSSALRTYFGRRVAGNMIASNVTAAGTTFTVSSNSAFTANQYLHIGKETIKVGAVDGDGVSLTGCTRGTLGTTATAHPQNELLSTAPRYWMGRKAWLVVGTQDGAGQWSYSDPYKTFYFENAPAFEAGAWSLRLADAMTYLDRPFNMGFYDVPVNSISIADGQTRYRVYMDDMRQFVAGGVGQTLAAWIEADGEVGVFAVDSVQSDHLRIYPNKRSVIPNRFGRHLTFVDLLFGEIGPPAANFNGEAKCRACYPMMGETGDPNAASCALRVMLSDLGGNTVDARYDSLGGVVPDTAGYLPRIRAGAGLAAAEVDKTAWQDAQKYSVLPSRGYLVGPGGERSLMEFLSKDIAPMLGGYVYVTNAGLVSFKKYLPATSATSADLTITDANHGAEDDNMLDDESPIVGSIKVYGDYDWISGRFMAENEAYYTELHRLFEGSGGVPGFADKKITVQSRLAGYTKADIETLFDFYISRWGDGSQRFSLVAKHAALLLQAGDTVSYTNTRLPDGAGSQGISALLCEVTKATYNFGNDTASVELSRKPTCKLIAPSCTLDTDNGGNNWDVTAIQSTNDINTEWAVDWVVKFIDTSGNIRTTSGNTTDTITAVTASTITFNGDVTPSATDTVILADWSDVSAITATNTVATAKPSDYAYFSTEGQDPTPGHKWG